MNKWSKWYELTIGDLVKYTNRKGMKKKVHEREIGEVNALDIAKNFWLV